MRTIKAQISLRIHLVWSAPFCSLPREQDTHSYLIQNFNDVACLCSCRGWFESYLVRNPEDTFLHGVAHMYLLIFYSDWGDFVDIIWASDKTYSSFDGLQHYLGFDWILLP